MNSMLKKENPNNISLIDSFGKTNYFSAIKNSKFLLGNSSSGIIEAASFKKHVLNIGKRQDGRIRSENVVDSNFNKAEILKKSKILLKKSDFSGKNKYSQKITSNRILKYTLKYLNN
jgi:GDP/UDP-N,N'-diacetylbacillosamine 2-epimerase (hydrolysing)